jgi:predicted glycogen debranching enzyme
MTIERERLTINGPTWKRWGPYLSERVWMAPGANTTTVRYDLRPGSQPVALTLAALVNYRDYHGSTHGGGWRMEIEPVVHGLRITAFDGARPFVLLSDTAEATPAHDWRRAFFLSAEAERGLDATEDHLLAGRFAATLRPGETLTLVVSTEPAPDLDGMRAYATRRAYEGAVLARAGMGQDRPTMVTTVGAPDRAAWLRHLALAADQFVVRRPLPGDPDGRSIIAGHHWFGDWGRDAMIALPGLTLATGRPEVAASILRTVARFVDRGMLPNRFPDAAEAPEYNTVDAALWYVEAIRAYHAATGDDDALRDLFPTLRELVAWRRRGARYAIRVDADGLLHSGEAGVQLTWMDVKIGDWVVTPRTGKAVEVNALWYNALRVVAAIDRRLGESADAYTAAADRVAASFGRFWNEAAGCLYDVVDGPAGDDPRIRPNQILAVALPHSPLDARQQRAVVDVCARQLVTSHGLRSLAQSEPAYAGHYGGPPGARDAAYHQGTVWPWLIGPFVEAHLRVHDDPARARSFLDPLLDHLASACIGSISEIFDGDPPHAPHGCVAQAWSVAAVLRAWQACAAATRDPCAGSCQIVPQ